MQVMIKGLFSRAPSNSNFFEVDSLMEVILWLKEILFYSLAYTQNHNDESLHIIKRNYFFSSSRELLHVMSKELLLYEKLFGRAFAGFNIELALSVLPNTT
jgi:hypothetical protein